VFVPFILKRGPMTVDKYIRKKNYRSIMIIHQKFILALRQLRNKNPEIPECCRDVGQLFVKAVEIKKKERN
jgi:hypothetical protein